MDCTRVAVCKIDSSKVCPSIANNRITGILKFNNFSYDEGGVRVWQAYGIGEGVYFDEFEDKQDVSGLERDGEWSAAVEKQRSRENRQNPSQMEAHEILAAPTHAWILHVS